MPHIAIDHYGHQRVMDIELNERVPCYKLGYSSSQATIVKLAMGDQVRHVKRKGRTSYQYVQFHEDARMVSHKGWLILEVDEAAILKVEGLTRTMTRSGVWRYNSDTRTWELFPEGVDGHYTPMENVVYARGYERTLGSYHPAGTPGSATTDEISGSGMTATRSQRSENDTPWWWLSGDTYPHKEVFKAHGGRWSKKRRQWYFITEMLPPAVLALLATDDAPDTEPGDSSSDDGWRPSGVRTTIGPVSVLEIARQARARETNDQSSPEPPTESAQPVDTIQVPEVVAATIKDSTGVELPTDQPVVTDTVRELMHMAGISTLDSETLPPELVTQPERVEDIWTQPGDSTDWQHNTTTLPTTQAVPLIDDTYQLPMQYVGRVAVAGECLVFGLAVHNSHPVYLNLVGAGTAVEAVWAKLAQGKEIIISPDTGPSIPVKPKEAGQYDRFQAQLGNLGTDHLILIHRDLLYPVYDELSTTFIIYADDRQFTTKLGQHLNELLDIAVFPDWYPRLRQIAEATGSARPCQCYGGLAIWSLTLDQDRWTRTIQFALENGDLTFPETEEITHATT